MVWVHCYFLARVRSIRRSKSRSKNPTGYPTRFMHAMLIYTSSTIEIANPNHSTSRESWRGVTAKNNPFWDAYKGYLYLESLVSANRLFMMPKAPTPPEKPFCRELPHTVLGYPFADSDSCFCMMASEILLDPVKSRMEIISPESLRPSVSLSQGPSESGVRAKRPRLRREPGLMALRRPKKALALLQRWQHMQLIFPSIQLRTCLMTIEMTLKSE